MKSKWNFVLLGVIMCCSLILFTSHAYSSISFSDDFNDNIIDPTKWDYYGNKVIEEDGIMKVETTMTDKWGVLQSTPININSQKILTISRKVIVHRNNDYFNGRFWIIPVEAPEKTFGLNYFY